VSFFFDAPYWSSRLEGKVTKWSQKRTSHVFPFMFQTAHNGPIEAVERIANWEHRSIRQDWPLWNPDPMVSDIKKMMIRREKSSFNNARF
jgi:hypothetical protein